MSVSDSFRATLAAAYVEWAVNPHGAAQMHAYLFERAPEPVTFETVENALGEDAARAWVALREAKQAFMKVAMKGTK